MDITTLIIQGGSLGLLAVVVVLVIIKVLPEERKARNDQAASFLSALTKHEEDHRTELNTIIEGHKTAMSKLADNENHRLEMMVEMRTEMRRQTQIMSDAFGVTEAREARDAAPSVRVRA